MYVYLALKRPTPSLACTDDDKQIAFFYGPTMTERTFWMGEQSLNGLPFPLPSPPSPSCQPSHPAGAPTDGRTAAGSRPRGARGL